MPSQQRPPAGRSALSAPAGLPGSVPSFEPATEFPHAVPPSPTTLEAMGLFTGLAGFGAAAVVLAISSTILNTAPPAPGIAGAALAGLWGLAVLAGAVQSLRNGWKQWPALIRRLLPVATGVLLLVLVYELWQLPVSSRYFDVPVACAILLHLALSGALGWLQRTTAGAPTPMPGRVPAGRLLAVTLAAAVAVAAVATPGLAASAAGQHAVPHGEHGSQQQINDPAQHHH